MRAAQHAFTLPPGTAFFAASALADALGAPAVGSAALPEPAVDGADATAGAAGSGSLTGAMLTAGGAGAALGAAFGASSFF